MKCDARTNGDHCYHLSGNPFQLPGLGASMCIPTMCCWCAPDYIRLTIHLDSRVKDEDLTVQQMTHGPRVRVERLPKRPTGPQIVVPNGL